MNAAFNQAASMLNSVHIKKGKIVINFYGKSKWKVKSATGGTCEIGFPSLNVGAVLTTGSVIVEDASMPLKHTAPLVYMGIGVTAGLSTIPSPVNLSASTKNMPCSGDVFRFAKAGKQLEVEEFLGNALMVDISGDLGATASLSFILFGVPDYIPLVAFSCLGGAMVGPILGTLPLSNGCIILRGAGLTLLPANVGISIAPIRIAIAA